MISLTSEQEDIIKKAVKFYNDDNEKLFQYTGPAGTGKSVIMQAIISELGLEEEDVAPMAFTGAATIVMKMKGLRNARTIHSWMFEPREEPDYEHVDAYTGKPYMHLKFSPKSKGTIRKKLICIDEASMVPMSIRKVIESHDIKVIACGDINQLPPVTGDAGYLYSGEVHHLTQIMRQAQDSPIVFLANKILNRESFSPGSYGSVLVITPDQITNEMLTESDIVLCGRNATREKYNREIRQLLGHDPYDKLPRLGERIICRKNNWNLEVDGINLANGLIGTVTNDYGVYGYNKKSFTIDFRTLLFGIEFKELKCSMRYFNCEDPKQRERLKEQRYEKGEKFELGYCITTHLSQGSQFNNGMYISEPFHPDSKVNLDYTGITRFADSCIYVVQKRRKFF